MNDVEACLKDAGIKATVMDGQNIFQYLQENGKPEQNPGSDLRSVCNPYYCG